MELVQATDKASSGLIARPEATDESRIIGKYLVECRGEDGSVKWSDTIDNLITTVGKNAMLDQYLAGSAWSTGTVYAGLVNGGTTPSYNAADTMSSHAGWTEVSASANRVSVSFSAAASGSKATSAASSFSVNATATVAGCFIVVGGTNAISNTTGTLFSVGNFSGGNRSVVSGDTLNVTYTATLT